MKRTYDSVRPGHRHPAAVQRKKDPRMGAALAKGTVEMDGSQWIPYQPASFPTPPSLTTSQATARYSAAGAAILRLWTGSDRFGDSVTFAAGSSRIEQGVTPAMP